MFFLLFSQLKSANQNKIGFTFPSKISLCHCVNWQARFAWVIPAHLDYLLPRQQDAVKGNGVCGRADEPGLTLTQFWIRVALLQMISKMVVLWGVSSQDLLSLTTLWLHIYCLEIGIPPLMSFGKIWFKLFCRCAYATNTGRTSFCL